MKPSGYNIGYNMGLAAGASIEHLHLHIIPRYPREIGIAELIAGSRVLVQHPRETQEIRLLSARLFVGGATVRHATMPTHKVDADESHTSAAGALRLRPRAPRRPGKSCYLVGGAVRDYLLGREVSDFDVATDARPEEIVRAFKRVIPTGIKHGTVTVLFKGLEIEVTTFRTESVIRRRAPPR